MKVIASLIGYWAGAGICYFWLHFDAFETIVVGCLVAICCILIAEEGKKR